MIDLFLVSDSGFNLRISHRGSTRRPDYQVPRFRCYSEFWIRRSYRRHRLTQPHERAQGNAVHRRTA